MTIGHRSIATHLVMAQQAITGGTATVLSFSGCAMPKSQGLAMFGCASGFFWGVCLVHVLCLTLGIQLGFTVFSYIGYILYRFWDIFRGLSDHPAFGVGFVFFASLFIKKDTTKWRFLELLFSSLAALLEWMVLRCFFFAQDLAKHHPSQSQNLWNICPERRRAAGCVRWHPDRHLGPHCL